MKSPVAYWHVTDIEAKIAEVTAAGATVNEPAHERGRWSPGGHRRRPRRQRARAAPGPMSDGPRSGVQRRRDTEQRLAGDVDLWVATASADGVPYLVPLSFDWDGETLLLATPTDSPTGRNLASGRTVRLGLGRTRDVTMIDGEVRIIGDRRPANGVG